MRESFHGWRRKVGCLSIVLACAVIALGIRSRTNMDSFRFAIGDRQHRLSSTRDYGLAWESWGRDFDKKEGDPLLVSEVPHAIVAIPLAWLATYLLFWGPTKRDE